MAKRHCLIFILLLAPLINIAQPQAKKYRLVDKKDKQPVAYAHIISRDYQSITNLDGIFYIPVKFSNSPFDVSCVGYQAIRFIPDSLRTDILLLDPSTELIDPVIITSMSPADILFRSVDNMQGNDMSSPVTADYWYAGSAACVSE